MSKKKMRAFAGAMAVVLAFVPFLSGCAANDAEDNPQAQQELNADEQSRNEAEGSIGETVQYGQVMAMNGSTATVVVGTLANANDGSGSQAFNAGQDEITFDEGDVSIVDESGAELEGRTLSADDVIVMRGTGSGTDFKPTTIEILDVAGAVPAMEPFVCGFSDDGKGVQSADQMRDAMELAKQLDKPITAHCEDESLLTPGWCIHDGEWAKRNGFPGNAPESEWKQVERDLELVRETGCRYHVCHVSTKESVALIRKAKAEGLPVSCETGPHYLILCDEDLMDDGRFKMNPPIRSAADRDALIEGLLDGTIDCIATDHAPHSAEEKSRGLRSLNGIVGLESAFPLLNTELVEPGIVPFATLLNALCVNPRRLFRLPGGKIEAGEIADLTVLDLNRPHAINSGAFFSRGRSTPFDGWTVTAGVDKTICNGNLVYTASSRNINKTPIPPCQEDYL